MREWTCAICGKTETWGRAWKRYGSIAADEDCGHNVPTCSDACRDTKRALELTTEFDRKHAAGRCRRTA